MNWGFSLITKIKAVIAVTVPKPVIYILKCYLVFEETHCKFLIIFFNFKCWVQIFLEKTCLIPDRKSKYGETIYI